MRSYANVLRRPGATRLFASGLIARLPQGMTSLAILLLVRAATHSYAAAGIAVGAEALASAVLAPPLGRAIDRRGRRYVLGRCAVGYALALALLVLAAQLHAGEVALVALAAVGGALLPPIAPSLRAMLPDVFGEARLRESAYALESVAQELVWITGPLLVALIITFFSPSVALLLIAADCVVGTALFLRVPLVAEREGPAVAAQRGAALRSGALRALLVPITLMGMALGATEIGLPALALHAGSRSAAGVLLALWSVGSMAGGLAYGTRRWAASLTTRYSALLLAAVACTAPLILARSLTAGIVFTLLAGLTVAPVFSCQYALVGEAVAAGAETEAFTWVSAALVSGIAAGSAAGGALVSAAGFSAPFAFACAATGVAAAMAFVARAIVHRPVTEAA